MKRTGINPPRAKLGMESGGKVGVQQEMEKIHREEKTLGFFPP